MVQNSAVVLASSTVGFFVKLLLRVLFLQWQVRQLVVPLLSLSQNCLIACDSKVL